MSDEYLSGMRGTRLSGKEFYKEVLSVTDHPEIEYSWATGVAITEFLAGLKEGKVLAAYCRECDKKQVPPMMFCHECYSPMNKYVEVPDTGIINTFSLAYINTDATRRESPEIPIVVDFDGTTNEPSGIMHKLDEDTDLDKIKIGSKIKAVWKDAEDRVGDITDIKYFKLVEEDN